MTTLKSRLHRTIRIAGFFVVLLAIIAMTTPADAQPNAGRVISAHFSAPAGYPPDPPGDISWSTSYDDLNDVITAFNNARSSENALLGTFLKPMIAPSDATWAQMSEGEKALWLVNQERTARGLAPLQGLETNVNQVAQAYAEWLLANNKFDHDADGRTPWERLDAKPAIATCHDELQIAENLYWQGTTSSDGIPLVIEQAIYSLMYEDSLSQWGHRHAILWTPYTENNGASDREGYLGVGHARGSYISPFNGKLYNNTDMIVMNFFDPCSTWVEAPPATVPPPPTPEPVETPKPPPLTHAASGKTSLPAWDTVIDQPFETNTWPGDWAVTDADGATNGDYHWIAATCNVYAGKYSGMAIGGGKDGMPLTCDDSYPNNAKSWMTYGPFSLEDAIGAIVQAKIWVYTETDNDELCALVSLDDQRYYGTCFSGNSSGWVEEQLDLSHIYQLGSVLGKSNIYVAFAFYSNDTITRPYGGAYVDNIILSKNVIRGGSALYGVAISSEDNHVTIADQDGNFSLVGLSPGIHTLTPLKVGYEFYPPSVDVDLSAGDITGISFVGVPRIVFSEPSNSLHLPLIRP